MSYDYVAPTSFKKETTATTTKRGNDCDNFWRMSAFHIQETFK